MFIIDGLDEATGAGGGGGGGGGNPLLALIANHLAKLPKVRPRPVCAAGDEGRGDEGEGTRGSGCLELPGTNTRTEHHLGETSGRRRFLTRRCRFGVWAI